MNDYILIALYLSAANLVVLGTILMFPFAYNWVKNVFTSATHVDTYASMFRDPIR